MFLTGNLRPDTCLLLWVFTAEVRPYESCELRGNFLSMEKVPIKTDINVGKAAKEWLIKKVNEKGVIKLVIPDFNE